MPWRVDGTRGAENAESHGPHAAGAAPYDAPMDPLAAWLAIAVSALIVAIYELQLARAVRRRPESRARSAHGLLRSEWVTALEAQPGFEIVAVQTLRNSLMSATITASTAALALMGTLSFTAAAGDKVVGMQVLTARAALELMLLATLFASFVSSAMAMRYYNHAGFAMSLPAKSEPRRRRMPMAVDYVRRAGVLYSWGLRFFMYMAPIVAGLVSEPAMPLAALVLVVVLRGFDRVPSLAPSVAEPPA